MKALRQDVMKLSRKQENAPHARPTPHRWGLKGLRGKKAMALTLNLLL